MAIYLDQQTRPYLERLFKKLVEDHPKDFIAERILKMLKEDHDYMDQITNCQHEFSHYEGKRESCVYCGTLGREEWNLVLDKPTP